MSDSNREYKLTFPKGRRACISIAGLCDEQCLDEFITSISNMEIRIKDTGGVTEWLKLQKKNSDAGKTRT